jgi:hypothetical protein
MAVELGLIKLGKHPSGRSVNREQRIHEDAPRSRRIHLAISHSPSLRGTAVQGIVFLIVVIRELRLRKVSTPDKASNLDSGKIIYLVWVIMVFYDGASVINFSVYGIPTIRESSHIAYYLGIHG